MTKYTVKEIVPEAGSADGATEAIGVGDGTVDVDGGADGVGLPAAVATGSLPAPTPQPAREAISPSIIARMSKDLEVEPFIAHSHLSLRVRLSGGWARPVTAPSPACNNVVTGLVRRASVPAIDGITY